MLHCFVCGKEGTAAILEAVGLKMSDLMPENRSSKSAKQFAEYKGGQFVKSYDYGSDDGYAFTKCRVLLPDGSKKFLYCRTDNYNKVVEYKVPDKAKYKALYPFKALQAAFDDDKTILYVEGEKDADNANSDGFHAITAGGAQDWLDDLADYFKGLNVVIVPDNDKPGLASAQKVAQSMMARGISAKMIHWDEDFMEKGDYSDFIESFEDRSEAIAAFKEKIEEVAVLEKLEGLATIYGKEVFVNVNEDFISDIPDTPWIIEGLVAKGETTLLSGASKAGKSYMVTQLAIDTAMGRRFLNQFRCNPVPVLYLNGENTMNDARRRFQKVCHALYIDPRDGKKITMACLDGRYEVINNIKAALIEEIHKGEYGLVIVDPLYCFYKGSEIDEQDAKIFVTVLKEISREADVGVLVVHHHSKGGQAFYANSSSRASGSGMLQRAFSSLLDLSEIRDLDLPEGARAFEFSGEVRESPNFKINLIYEYPLWKYDEKGLVPDNAANKARTAAARDANKNIKKSAELKELLPSVIAEAFSDPFADAQGDYTTFGKIKSLCEGRGCEVSDRTLKRYFDDREPCVIGYVRDKRPGHAQEIRKQEFDAASSIAQCVFEQ